MKLSNAAMKIFWNKVKKTSTCWLWQGSIEKKQPLFRYGKGKNKKKYRAQRISYELIHGTIPDKKRVKRTCQNEKCINPAHLTIRSEEDRFWFYVNKISNPNGCWTWTGGTKRGYGQFSLDTVKGGEMSSHRYSWELKHGKIPKNMLVCHHCDNPPCVNPSHLFLGTHTDNMQDMINKGRKGKNTLVSKLTAKDVQYIRICNLSAEKLATYYGVTSKCIREIKRRATWKHVI
jgi:hypothetical protein